MCRRSGLGAEPRFRCRVRLYRSHFSGLNLTTRTQHPRYVITHRPSYKLSYKCHNTLDHTANLDVPISILQQTALRIQDIMLPFLDFETVSRIEQDSQTRVHLNMQSPFPRLFLRATQITINNSHTATVVYSRWHTKKDQYAISQTHKIRA